MVLEVIFRGARSIWWTRVDNCVLWTVFALEFLTWWWFCLACATLRMPCAHFSWQAQYAVDLAKERLRILRRSCKNFTVQSQRCLMCEGLVQSPVQVFEKRCCEDPGDIGWEVLAWSYTGPCEKMLWKSWWHALRGPCVILPSLTDLVEMLKSCLRGPCIKIFKMPCHCCCCFCSSSSSSSSSSRTSRSSRNSRSSRSSRE